MQLLDASLDQNVGHASRAESGRDPPAGEGVQRLRDEFYGDDGNDDARSGVQRSVQQATGRLAEFCQHPAGEVAEAWKKREQENRPQTHGSIPLALDDRYRARSAPRAVPLFPVRGWVAVTTTS